MHRANQDSGSTATLPKVKNNQIKANYQNRRMIGIKGPDSAMHLRTMSHAGNDLHELFKFLLGHRLVVITGVIFKTGVFPHPPSSGLQGLDPPTNIKSYEIHSIYPSLLHVYYLPHQRKNLLFLGSNQPRIPAS